MSPVFEHYDPFEAWYRHRDSNHENRCVSARLPSQSRNLSNSHSNKQSMPSRSPFPLLPIFEMDEWFKDLDNTNLVDHALNKDVIVKPEFYKYIFDMPGFDKKDIQVFVEDGYLHVEGVRKNEEQHEDAKSTFMSRSMGSFKEVIPLHDDSLHEQVKASFENGVLSLTIPRHKMPEKDTRKRIDIQ